MPMRWSPSTGHFYHADLNAAQLPADAVRVTRRRHAELLEGRSAGRTISAGANGKPVLSPIRKPTLDQLRRQAIVDIKREARARILNVASLERQANDNAALVLGAIDGGSSSATLAARARRLQIDAIRTVSNTLEAAIATWSAGALATFDASAVAHWPA